MKTTFVSTPAFVGALRTSIRETEAALFRAQKELASGRHADVGLALGSRTGVTVSLREQSAGLTAIIETNKIVRAKLQTSQLSLQTVSDGASAFLSDLVAARDSLSGPDIVQEQARRALDAMTGALNQSYGGDFVFGGINIAEQPLLPYDDPSSPRAAVDAAFLAEFGFAQDDPAAAGITGVQMAAFLDGAFAALFDDAGWRADWSNASPDPLVSRISTSETQRSSASADEAPVRHLAQVYTMIGELGATLVSRDAFTEMVDRAITLTSNAIAGIGTIQSRLGTVENRVDQADTRLGLQIDIVERRIAGLEGVDAYEAALEVNLLTTQVETAFALTARIQRLGLLQYL